MKVRSLDYNAQRKQSFKSTIKMVKFMCNVFHDKISIKKPTKYMRIIYNNNNK
jgi:hypothetical protein